MLLVLTATDDATADFLCERLSAEAVSFLRVNTDAFSTDGFVEFRKSELFLLQLGKMYRPEDFTNVWLRRPRGIATDVLGSEAELLHLSREWGASLDNFLNHIDPTLWMNHPSCNVRASSKILQLNLARELGLLVPDTLITRSSEEAISFWRKHSGSLVIKPLSTGYVEDNSGRIVSRIFTNEVPRLVLQDPMVLSQCPTLLQERVPKGVDIRVTVIDRQVIAIAMHPKSATTVVDIRRVPIEDIAYEKHDIPELVRNSLLALMNVFHLRFCAVDFVVNTSGEWFFLELNPNGQWAWTDMLGISDIAKLFVNAFHASKEKA